MAKSRGNPSIKHSKTNKRKEEKPHSWAVVRSLFTCKHLQVARLDGQQVILKEEKNPKGHHEGERVHNNNNNNDKKCKKMKCSGSICSNTKVMHRPEPSPSPPKGRSNCKNIDVSNSRSIKVNTANSSFSSSASASASSSSLLSSSPAASSSIRGMPFRKLSGCYECRMVVDPIARDPSLRSTICSECGQIFMKVENLELHQAVRHAVSELGPEDTSRNIVEIIFQSSWLNKRTPVCKIDRILKIRNTPRTISRFEEYREAIKVKASHLVKKHPRCIADGNELLRFHCTTFMCSLGLNGSSNLCTVPNCDVCTLIKNGFKLATTTNGTKKGILTTATSGKAHDNARVVSDEEDDKRAMLVCRVIAGRVKKNLDGNSTNNLEEYDSISGAAGVYSNLDELYVFNPKAILPCFVVIYKGF